ncbi:sodium ion-translocating decarboxylase subunit beta [Tepidibacter hydrothermalis]|uniref:Sodium ion-translocating decarboxylase subunit beta n=1 Tax=Tepidibacter hydrothermalis TaxID=3036126 RepID=A0ABY8EA75_9FIRM|nr:sodium ion-translocating decarboxylase subunit beta [Tepidibacter hydrothermalis]WFD08830.1 sodium ion-translocating decarboxylase subunit beta [Tepidibacter hydrothermalis]
MKYRIIKKYDLKIHTMISLCVCIFINVIRHMYSVREAYSVGIIGGADGPTAIYLCGSDNVSHSLMTGILIINKFSFIPIFIILVLLYKPVKYIIEKIKVG